MEQTVLMVGMAAQVQEVSSLSNEVRYSQQPILWMTVVYAHPHEHPWDNPHQQVRLCKTIATLSPNIHILSDFFIHCKGDPGLTGGPGKET